MHKFHRPNLKPGQFRTMNAYEKEEYVEYLLDIYGDSIYRLAYTYVKDWGKAEDITQDVFVTCFEKLETFRGEQYFFAVQSFLLC